MPRETLDIEAFNKGIVSSPDAENTNNDGALYSLDIENDSDEGRLEGRLADTDASLKDIGVGETSMLAQSLKSSGWIIRPDGKRDLAFYSHGGMISVITDYYGGQSVIDLVDMKQFDAGKEVTFAAHNREAHVGMGSNAQDAPQWVGYAAEGRAGQQSTDKLIITDAELTSPQRLPFFHKVVVDASYVYGIQFDTNKLYKVDRSNGSFIYSDGEGSFRKLRAICDEDATYLWIFDATASTNGTIYKITKSDLSVASSASLGSYTLETGAMFTDMISTTNKVWLAAHYPNIPNNLLGDINRGTEKWLFSVAKSAIPGTSITVTNNSPWLRKGSDPPFLEKGDWMIEVGTNRYAVFVPVFETYELSLVKVTATIIGWAFKPQPRVRFTVGAQIVDSDVYYVTDVVAPATGIKPGSILYQVPEGSLAGAKRPIIKYDADLYNRRYFTGFYYDTSDNSLYRTRNNTIIKNTGITLPAVAGDAVDISAGSTTAATSNNDAVVGKSTQIFMVRTEETSGITKINTDLTGYAADIDGSQIAFSVAAHGSINSFSTNTKYYYKLAFLYDGYQYSPLTPSVVGSRTNTTGNAASTITLTINSLETIPDRVDAIKIFRSRSPSTDSEPDEFYREIDSVELSDIRWSSSGGALTIVIDDVVEDKGQSYEAITGMPETLTTSMVNYTYSALLNNQLFVAKCYKNELGDSQHYLFRSKTGRLDTFDWTADFLRLPIIPVAIAAFAGRIWIFNENQALLINPDGLYVEEVYDGVGADNYRSVCVTEVGMFVCNKNSIWVCDGRKFHNISIPIETVSSSISGVTSWRDTLHTSYGPFIIAHPKKNSILFVVSTGVAGQNNAFVYNYLRQRWDYWSLSANTANYSYVGGYTGKDGEAYFTTNVKCQQVQGGNTRMAFTWISKLFAFGDDSQIKKVYKVIPQYEGAAATISYAKDNGTSFTATSGNAVATADWRIRSFMVKIVGATTTKIRSIGLILRRMIGKR